MNILYITNEAPFFPAGGIATYLAYAAAAMKSLGHEIYIIAWTDNNFDEHIDTSPFPRKNVKIVRASRSNIQNMYQGCSINHATSLWLSPIIENCVNEWKIDVIEAADYLSPCLVYYQNRQASSSRADLLCVTYNHGFAQDFFDADQIIPNQSASDDAIAERQQCRYSDLIVTPSAIANNRIRQYGINVPTFAIREPYIFNFSRVPDLIQPSLTYIGRISISKGIDKVIQIANNIDDFLNLEQIILIGRCVNTPFRKSDIKSYTISRLSHKLKNKVVFTDYLPRNLALSLLRPGSFCPSLGSAETFSYSCIESIDAGLIPIVRHGTPMAEFFPEDMNEYIFQEDLGSSSIIRNKFESIANNGKKIVSDLIEYNKEILDPTYIAQKTSDKYLECIDGKKSTRKFFISRDLNVDDVSILIPAYNPNTDFLECIDSICSQTAGTPSVIICNDGSSKDSEYFFDYVTQRIPNAIFINQPNNGLLGARMALIEKAETKLALFLDIDDILDSKYLEKCLSAYNNSARSPDAVITARLNFGDSNEFNVRNLFSDHIHFVRNDFRMTALIDTNILKEIGFDPTRRNGEADDWIFWLEFFSKNYDAIFIPDSLFYYRFKSGSMSWPWSIGQAAGTSSMMRKVVENIIKKEPEKSMLLSMALQTIMQGQ